MSAFPKTMRAAADGIRRYIRGTDLEQPGAEPLVVAVADSVIVTSSSRADVATWLHTLQQMPYRASFRVHAQSDGRVCATITRLDPAGV